MHYSTLGRTGLRVSRLGFGASPLGNEFHPVDPADAARAVHAALDHGINLFDTAPYYGRTLSEERLGAALEGRRHQAIIATKCCRYDKDDFDFSAARVTRSVEESLRRLRTDVIDVFQVHDIEFGDERLIVGETLPAMRQLQRQGKVRFIGITGLQLRMIRRVAEAFPVDTILSYCRYNLLNTELDTIVTPFAQQQEIGLINASPFHMGVLTDGGPPAWHPSPERVRVAGAAAAALCRDRGVDVSAVALQFALNYTAAASTLTGMASAAHVEANVKTAAAQPDPDLIRELQALVAPAADVVWQTGRAENCDAA